MIETTERQAAGADLSSRILTHLQRLEGESIHILREVVAESERPGEDGQGC